VGEGGATVRTGPGGDKVIASGRSTNWKGGTQSYHVILHCTTDLAQAYVSRGGSAL
jgi:hypothetical protein